LTNVQPTDSSTWTKYIEVYKKDEGKRRQISGPRNFVSDAKMYRYTQGTRNRSRGYNNNFRGNDRNYYGNNNNRYHPNDNRDMISRDEMNEKIQQAARMERFIANAGEHARDQRGYDRDCDSARSDISFANTGKSQRSDDGPERSRADSLEFDYEPVAPETENVPIELTAVTEPTEVNEDDK
jgi:outer membrane receptor protein involved in Fe transport